MLDPNDPASLKILMRENDELEDRIQSIKRLIIKYKKELDTRYGHGYPDIMVEFIYDLEAIL